MLLSHSHKFIFVHVQRTGGGTISRVLDRYAHRPPKNRLNRYLSKTGLVRDPHKVRLTAHGTALTAKRLLPAAVFDEYFKFAFVRNPWSWLVSLYFRFGTTESHRHHKYVSKMSFGEFIDWEIARNKRHQHLFVCDKRGEVIVDFIGKLENLHADILRACAHIGVDPQLETLPRVGARKHKDYHDYYDDAIRAKVAAHWARDIELFGYDFDGPLSRDGKGSVASAVPVGAEPGVDSDSEVLDQGA